MKTGRISKFSKVKVLLLISFFAMVSFSAYGQQFSIIFNVTDGPNNQDITMGVHPNGTNGYDAGLDTYAPPLPPTGAFDARFTVDGEDYLTDIRDNSMAEKTFEMKYQESSSGTGLIISWDTTGFGNTIDSIYMTDNITGGLFGPLDMTTVTTVNIGTEPLLSTGLKIMMTTKVPNGIDEAEFEGSMIGESFILHSNYPNPFNGETRINFSVNESSFLKLNIYNILGVKIKSLASQKFNPGNYKLKWNGKNVEGLDSPSGIYFAVLEGGKSQQSIKLFYMK